MRIFLTGGAGFIGSHVVKQALAAGHAVTALRLPGEQPKVSLPAQPDWVEGNLASDWSAALAGCDMLIHLAAVGVSPQKATSEQMLQVNAVDSLQLASRAVALGLKRLIICGSCFEYGRSGERYEFIPPDAPLEPTTAYGASKAAATMMMWALSAEKKVELLVLRPFHVYGEGQHASNFWPALRAAALGGQDFSMSKGEQVRDFIPVEQVAAAFVSAVTRTDLRPGQPKIENLGTGQPQTIRHLAEYWWQTWKATGKLLVGTQPYRENEVMRYVPLIQRAA